MSDDEDPRSIPLSEPVVDVSFRTASFEEVAPFIDELNEPFTSLHVRPDRSGGGPFPEGVIMALLYVTVIHPYVKAFFSRAGEAHYDALHEQFARLLKRLGNSSLARQEAPEVDPEVKGFWVPIAIKVGRCHFNFQGELEPEDVVERFTKAQEYIQALPEEELNTIPFPPGAELNMSPWEIEEAGGTRYLFWDLDSDSWVEKVWDRDSGSWRDKKS